MQRLFERRRPVALAPVIEAENDVSGLGQQLIGRALPAGLDPAARRSAIDLHDHGILFRGVEARRRGHLPDQGLAMAVQRAEGHLAATRHIGEDRMIGVQPVLLDPAHEGSVGAVKARLHRRVQVGVVADEGGARLVHRRAPPAAARRHRNRRHGPAQAGAEHLLFDRQLAPVAHRGGEEDLACALVDAGQTLHRPVAAGDGADAAAVAAVEVQMLPAGLFRRPDEITVVQRLEVVVQRHPGFGRPGQDHPRRARGRIDAQQIQRLLVPRLALDIEGAAVGGPVHAGQIDVCV